MSKPEQATFEVEPEEFDKPSDHPAYRLIALNSGKPEAKANHGDVTVEGKIVPLHLSPTAESRPASETAGADPVMICWAWAKNGNMDVIHIGSVNARQGPYD